MSRRWLRWMPAVVVPAVIAGGALAANAVVPVDLPSKTPDQVLKLVASSSVDAFSGTVEQTSQLGLPELPSSGPSSNADLSSALELLTGSHTARVYVDGPRKARVQVMDSLAERDVILNGSDVWLYDSGKNTATHATLPNGSKAGDENIPGDVHTPAQLAKRVLADLDPSTKVTVGTDTSVAGRTAYDLVLDPRSSETLVGSVSIAVDSKTGLPLSVDVMARGQNDPAFRVAFTKLSLQTPSADLFDFSPPPGATVKQQALPKVPSRSHDADTGSNATVTGSGWSTVVQLPSGTVPQKILDSPLLAQATKAVSGGRALSTSLVNVLVTSDGGVFAGSVPLDRLQAAADGR